MLSFGFQRLAMLNEALTSNTIIYEQPLNETMRICLRLEHQFSQLNQHIHNTEIESSKIASVAILKILEVISRPDIKSKLVQSLAQHASTLAQLEQFPQIDNTRLTGILSDLDKFIDSVHNNRNRIGEKLCQNEFLNQLRLGLGNPGGLCDFANPAYSLWLKKSNYARQSDLIAWAGELQELGEITKLILQITRDSAPSQKIIARDGFYHQNLNPALPCEMLRVSVPTDLGVFPEFSVGRHRLTIRFLVPNYYDKGRPKQLHEDTEFELFCCRA